MPVWVKDDTGTWQVAKRVYRKNNGVWTPITASYIKVGGVYQQGYLYDTTPPDPPQMSLELIENFDDKNNLTQRYIKVGVRANATSNDPQLQRIRVLTTYNKAAPTSATGQTRTETPDSDWPNERWSDWMYNYWGDHKDTSAWSYKQWTVNPGPNTKIPADTDFFFGAWSQDWNNNWSIQSTQMKLHTPKPTVDTIPPIKKESYFYPNQTGSFRGGGWHGGDLIQQNSPRSVGLFLYGAQLTQAIAGNATIQSAQLLLIRQGANVDIGMPSAAMHLFWSTYGQPSDLSGVTSLTRHEPVDIGPLDKGSSKWFDLPPAYYNDLNTNIKCLGLDYKSSSATGAGPADYSDVVSQATNVKVGALHVTWTVPS